MRKPVLKLLKSIGSLRAAIEASRDRIARRLAERQAAADISYDPVFAYLQAELTAVEPELSVAERAYHATRLGTVELRERRRLTTSRLAGEHAPIERLLRCQTHLKGIGAIAGTPQSPLPLTRQVRRTAQFLRKLEREQPPLACGIKIDAGGLAGDLEAGLRRLEASIDAFDEADARISMAQERANRAFDEAKRVVSCVARLYESLCGLVGEDELGVRIRKCCG